jgi:hypothetical protein
VRLLLLLSCRIAPARLQALTSECALRRRLAALRHVRLHVVRLAARDACTHAERVLLLLLLLPAKERLQMQPTPSTQWQQQQPSQPSVLVQPTALPEGERGSLCVPYVWPCCWPAETSHSCSRWLMPNNAGWVLG